jgi:mutator protein MutT
MNRLKGIVRMSVPKRIGVAVVEHGGRYLVGIRADDVPLAGFAEFPGGKCHPDESATNCAVRECLEESGLRVVADRVLHRVEFEYPHGLVDLHFILCHPVAASEVCEHHGSFRWVAAGELMCLKFPEANAGVIRLLTENVHP